MDMYFLSKLGDAVECKSICQSLEGREVTELWHENPAVGLITAPTAFLNSQNQLPVPGVSSHSHCHSDNLIRWQHQGLRVEFACGLQQTHS